MCKSGGIMLTLNFGVNRIHKVITIYVIQFIIRMYKDNNLACGRMGGYSLNVKVLYCDCDIHPSDSDNLYIGTELKCKFHSIDTIPGKQKTN